MINWTQSQKAFVSVGIYDAQGKLVKTLLGGKELPAGSYSFPWDGTNNITELAPAGVYSWKVIKNGNTYSEGIQLGNTGVPTTTAGIVPSFPEGIAVDAAGDVYTVNGYDEAHRDVVKWSGATGLAMLNTGHPIGDRVLEGIAVEPDGSFVYVVGVTGNRLDIASETRVTMFKLDLRTKYRTTDGYGRDTPLVSYTNHGERLNFYDANANYPAGFTDADKSTASIPIRSLALRGNFVYAPDSLGSCVWIVDKITGDRTAISGVPVACSIAIDGSGNIWVGHEHSKVSVYAPNGTLLGTPITTGLQEIRSLAISGNVLYAADDLANQVRKYTISGATATFVTAFGRSMVPGDRSNDALKGARALGCDSSGNLFIGDRPGDGRRVQKLSPSFTLIWQQFCLEFSSTASFSHDNPNLLWTSRQRAYQVSHGTGGWNYLGLGRTDTDGQYFGNFLGTDEGPPRVVSLNGQDFFFMPTKDNGIGIYRVIPSATPATKGPTIRLASCISAAWPMPDGGVPAEGEGDDITQYLWSWHDGLSAAPTPGTAVIYYRPDQRPYNFTVVATHVDDTGRLILGVANHWFPGTQYNTPEAASIWVITPTFNASGSPVYTWESAVKIFSNDDGKIAMELEGGEQLLSGLVAYADGSFYSMYSTNKAGAPTNPGAHSGGNVLMGFHETTPGTLQTFTSPNWKILLSKVANGLAPIRGGAGGVLIGADPELVVIQHYAKDGLLLKSFEPGKSLTGSYRTDAGLDWVSGGLDSLQCMQAERAPDGIVELFTQDNLNQRIIWFRIDDTHVSQIAAGSETIGSGNTGTHYDLTVNGGIGSGKYLAGATVQLRADDPAKGKAFSGWTGQITNANASASFVMPAAPATVTANYIWRVGVDKVRFKPGSSSIDMNESYFEGATNPNGPWTPFYDIPKDFISPQGWNEADVDFSNANYLRWRKRLPWNEGVVLDIEFVRNGVVVTGQGFGSAALDPQFTYDKALDNNPATHFTWADTGQLGAHVGIFDDQFVPPIEPPIEPPVEPPAAPTGLLVFSRAGTIRDFTEEELRHDEFPAVKPLE